MKYGIGISFDGALARAGLFDRSGKLVARASAEFSGEGRAEAAEKLAELAQSLGTRTGKRAETLGLCVPAAVDGASGEILRWDGAPDMVGPWGRELSRRLGMPVQLAGCGNAAALAEARFGAGKKYESLVYLSLGAAVRCGAVCGGEIFEGFGAGGVAAEHMSVEVGGVPCACGRRGCFGQYVSGAALVRDTKRAMFENKNSALWRLAGDADGVTADTAFEAARGGDAAAQKVVKNYIFYLSEGILNLANLLHPQAIVVGGEIAREGEYLLEPLRKYVGERLYVGCDSAPFAIVRAALGEEYALILGAFALALL